MSDSIWKKEIGFKRKKSDEAPPAEPPAPKQSIWKKEIGGKRKRDKEPPETAESLRVKELAFQRKLVEVAQAEVAQVVAPAPVVTPAPRRRAGRRRRAARAARSGRRSAAGGARSCRARFDLEEGDQLPPEAGRGRSRRCAAGACRSDAGRAIGAAGLHLEERDQLQAQAGGRHRRRVHLDEGPLAAPQAGAQRAGARARGRGAARDRRDRGRASPGSQGPSCRRSPLPSRSPSPRQFLRLPRRRERKPSIWKRELGKSKSKEPKVEKVADAPKGPKEPKAKREKKPRTRLRDVKLSLPKPSPKAHASSGHPVKRLVGLKIGASQLAAARVYNNGAAELVQVARQPLDQGVVVGGEVRDPEALAIALKQFFARNKLPRKNVRLGIASNRIGVRVFDLVGIDDEKQLENAIRFRAQEALPIPLDEAVLDYHVLGESVDADGTVMQRVLLVVAYRELVERYVSACKKAGITLAGVDLEAFALLRALGAPRGEDDESDSALVAVSIGHDRSTFAVSDGRICEFTRVIDWGGATLSVAIARALDLAPSEVEPLKRLVSLESPAVPEGVEIAHYTLAVDAVRRQVQAFARELVSSLQFYQHQPGSLGIGEIVITGGTAGLAGLAAELQSMIGVRVRVGDPLARLKVPKKLAVDDELGSLAIAIGLGIED